MVWSLLHFIVDLLDVIFNLNNCEMNHDVIFSSLTIEPINPVLLQIFSYCKFKID